MVFVWLVSDTRDDVSVAENVQFFLKVIKFASSRVTRPNEYISLSMDVLSNVSLLDESWYTLSLLLDGGIIGMLPKACESVF